MDVKTFFQQRHSYLHQSFLPNLPGNIPLDDFRKRPAPGTQPMIWLLWHMARVEDIGLSRFVWQKPQLFDENWKTQLNIDIDHYGTSMTEDEVMELAQKINVESLLQYQLAVGKRTVQELAILDTSILDEVLTEATVLKIVRDEGMASDKAQWVTPHYVGKTRGWMLCHFGLTHNFRHFGQVVMVRKMLGYG